MEKPLFPLALVPLAVGLVLIYVVIGSKNREDQKDSFACLLSAHGRCRRVDHREPTRMTLHAAARLPGYRPRPVHGSPRHSRNHVSSPVSSP